METHRFLFDLFAFTIRSPAWETVSIFFRAGTAPISVRVIATIGITHGRKTVSPSRNPCDSDPFLVATHNRCSPSWDPHRLLFFGQTASIGTYLLFLFFCLPPSVGLLLTVRTRFSVRSIAYEKASSLLSIASLEQFLNAITLELRASLLAGGLHFRLFLCLFGFA